MNPIKKKQLAERIINEAVQKRTLYLAGLITESQYYGEQSENNDIVSFLNQHKQELIEKLSEKWDFDEDDFEDITSQKIITGVNSDEEEDPEVAAFENGGLDFSFKPSKVKDVYGDASNFKFKIAGKTIYAIAYNF